ncbi:hypothetical protein L9F63_016956, partial [Diploptera punctata]
STSSFPVDDAGCSQVIKSKAFFFIYFFKGLILQHASFLCHCFVNVTIKAPTVGFQRDSMTSRFRGLFLLLKTVSAAPVTIKGLETFLAHRLFPKRFDDLQYVQNGKIIIFSVTIAGAPSVVIDNNLHISRLDLEHVL